MREINLFGKVKNVFKSNRIRAQTTSTPVFQRFAKWIGRTFWGIDNSTLSNNELIFSIISRISNTFASLPVKVYQNYEEVHNDISDLVSNSPNQNMTSFEFHQKMETDRNEHGNAYALIERDIRLNPVSLIPIPPCYVMPFMNIDDGSLWYEVNINGSTRYIYNTEIIHVKHITGSSRLAGISPIKVLTNALKYDKAVQEFSLKEMDKIDSFKIKYDANLGKEKQEAIVDNLRQFISDNGGALFEENGVTIDEIQRGYTSADTINSEKITRTKMANVFTVPVAFVNEVEGQSYSSNEQVMIQYVQMRLTPDVRQYEQEYNRKLLNPIQRKQGQYFKFSVNALLRGDMAARTAFYQSGVRNGYLKQDEVRMLEDYPPAGGNANKLWVSGDLYPIDMDPSLRKGGDNSGTKTKILANENVS
ncbi:phage portal protein [Clostridium kluyveri]|uniref:Phage portal protein n=2 Tax=Clostridium kluyveri TaxID=1534 RepID=A5F9J5_CLOK5|nr:phage portal protein [Clostridium kluyveri DSM 555]BAH08565.1 hypothetical protein CKR_P46 [Clostridium kluyveri NBRC 12016]